MKKYILYIRSNPIAPDPRSEKEINSLLKQDYSIEILAWDRYNVYPQKRSVLKLNDGVVPITRIGISGYDSGGFRKNFIPLLKFQLFIFRYIRHHRAKICCIHACDFDTAFITSICSKLYHLKYVYDIYDYYCDAFNVPHILHKFVRKMDEYVINGAEYTIICSEERREQISSAKPKQVVVIHNSPVDIDTEGIKTNNEHIRICYVGNLLPNRFLKELTDIVIHDKRFELHVGGFGLKEYEDFFVNMSRMYDNIFYYGKLPYDQTIILESKSDILTAIYDPTVPNHRYAAPNKFYEALMLGKPIIMIKGTGMSQIIERNNFGSVTVMTVNGIKHGLEKIIMAKPRWAGIAEEMRMLYRHQYSWDIMETRLCNIYADLASDCRRSAEMME